MFRRNQNLPREEFHSGPPNAVANYLQYSGCTTILVFKDIVCNIESESTVQFIERPATRFQSPSLANFFTTVHRIPRPSRRSSSCFSRRLQEPRIAMQAMQGNTLRYCPGISHFGHGDHCPEPQARPGAGRACGLQWCILHEDDGIAHHSLLHPRRVPSSPERGKAFFACPEWVPVGKFRFAPSSTVQDTDGS